ncbi:MAG: quinone-dependent dihydroorotate dehydrogenase [Cyclobacteriaceae bacterium]|nr:quinone-dependent dihydroorotate dehydrogenase [Cyclobacteriaceae bacterium]
MYRFFISPLLFMFDAERVHHFIFRILWLLGKVPGTRRLLAALYEVQSPWLGRTVFGLKFENPVGLAAGFDKDARLIDELACFGFGFIEIGTLTPKPQPGNEKPRLFRLPADKALINRMGFNNEGVLAAVERLKKRKSTIIVGGNIGKNKDTPNEKALDDYAYCVEALYLYVDYFVVNVSSPNTPGLRELQEKEPLRKLLAYVKALAGSKEKAKPVLLKIAPDLTVEQLDDVIKILKETKTDGIIATNTTTSREGLVTDQNTLEKIGAGGLSGKPLSSKSTEVIKYLRRQLGPDYPIIGVGGIMSVDDALEKLKAGANLIQIYTGFVYEGPSFVRQINRALLKNS